MLTELEAANIMIVVYFVGMLGVGAVLIAVGMQRDRAEKKLQSLGFTWNKKTKKWEKYD